MLDFVKKYVPEKMLEAAVLKVAGKIAAAAAAALVTMLVSHGFASVDATNVSEGLTAIISAIAIMAFHKWEGEAHSAQVTAAAAAGVSNGVALAQARQEGADTQAQADQSVVNAVASAIDTAGKAKADDKASIMAAVRAGTI